ncbi:multiple organellar RNA editing factor 8, chloroplastic/mitochondrial [Neltuma alba]|uniref:multiple organellar RNA editing factor 8, chloroplastic/mitochondrial n=1 Tax=Neltuma alba TaxID=207710 RepID=UPI0010A496AA|nr:multiple organellar RNA editing factor 8, chloroplastic/mitochondrial [Prosopis alba]XP_028763847.1 multiple organellar RNA editing factor 8, chloroplastic/mitochondrial [Prosopis alba]
MASQIFSRAFPKSLTSAFFYSRSLSSAISATSSAPLPVGARFPLSALAFLRRLRPLAVASADIHRRMVAPPTLRTFSTRATSSSLNDPNPNWSNRPPKETILLDGCDFEHWLVVMEKPEGEPTRDEIIDSYIKTLAQVVGSEEEARMKIYSVSTRHYFAFGALVSEELSYKLKELPRVRWVLPDSYLDVKNKDYGGEPFINGQAVPYDPKYHEEWVRNNARANERNRRNDRPRNADRSRNFERRRENIVNRDMQGRPPMQAASPNMTGVPPSQPGGVPPSQPGGVPPSQPGGFPPSQPGGFPPSQPGGYPPSNPAGYPHQQGGYPPNNPSGYAATNPGGYPSNNPGGYPSSNAGGYPSSNPGGYPPNNNPGGYPANNNPGGYPPSNNPGGYPPNNPGGYPPSQMGGFPPHNMGGGPPNSQGNMPPSNMGGAPSNQNMGGAPPNAGWSGRDY